MVLLPLAGVRVVEYGRAVAAAFATRMLALLGAEVTVVGGTREAADPLSESRMRWLMAGKRRAGLPAGEAAGDAFRELVGGADAVVSSHEPGSGFLDGDEAVAEWPRLVWCSVSPFGRSGPRAGRPATDLTLFAAGGQAWEMGEPGREPLTAAGVIPSCLAGMHVVGATLAALFAARRDGVGDLLDISLQECLVAMTQASVPNFTLTGTDTYRLGLAGNPMWSVYACKDGHAVMAALPTSYDRIAKAVGDPGIFDEFTGEGRGSAAAHRLYERFAAWFASQEKRAVTAFGAERECPFGYVATMEDLLASEQLDHRRFWVDVDGVRQPGLPWVVRHGSDSPRGADRGSPEAPGIARPPLHGIRVLDLTRMYAGPYCTSLLADLGADVIKVESAAFPDYTRFVTPRKWTHPRTYDTDPFYSFLNRNKRSLSLDLRHEEARAIARELAARADIVVENARTGVMESLGMGYDELRALNPRLIYVSMPGFGRTGPEAQQVSYATVVEGMSGHVALNGYHDDPQPQRSGTNYADPAGGTAAAAAAIAALIERERTGVGQAIDLAQRDVLATMVGDAIVYQQLYGAPPPRTGNRHPGMAPHGIYPCAASEGEAWVAIAVRDDPEWRALCREAGLDAGLAGLGRVERVEARDRLDAEVAAWSAVRTVEEVIAACDAAGVPVAPVASARGLAGDAHLAARGAWWRISDADLARPMLVHALPWRFVRRPARLRRAAPAFAAHNEAILGGELGLSPGTIAALEAEGAIARRPRLPGEGA